MSIELLKKWQIDGIHPISGMYGMINVLFPADESAEKKIAKMKCDKVYSADIKEIRNYKFHKKYFKLLKFAFDHLPEKYSSFYSVFENFRLAIETAVGNVEYYYSLPVDKEVLDEDRLISMFSNKKSYEYQTIISAIELSKVIKTNPEIRIKHRSIAFDKMEESDFEELYKKVLDEISKILDLSNNLIMNELELF